ncbi:MAG: DUF3006 domain-containing protein [Chloroflexi bacterium]|nr:DUF3006 domain-containing protein [Chloroflexota bacterium]
MSSQSGSVWQRAVIDRVEGALAVLLVGSAEEELTVPLAVLPFGAAPGDWLKVRLEGGKFQEAQLDLSETQQRRRRIRSKLDDLLDQRRRERR